MLFRSLLRLRLTVTFSDVSRTSRRTAVVLFGPTERAILIGPFSVGLFKIFGSAVLTVRLLACHYCPIVNQ